MTISSAPSTSASTLRSKVRLIVTELPDGPSKGFISLSPVSIRMNRHSLSLGELVASLTVKLPSLAYHLYQRSWRSTNNNNHNPKFVILLTDYSIRSIYIGHLAYSAGISASRERRAVAWHSMGLGGIGICIALHHKAFFLLLFLSSFTLTLSKILACSG